MRKTIGASEGSSIYLLGICAANLLSMFLMLILSNVTAVFDGMRVKAWVGYVVMQIGFIASVLIYARVRRLDEISVARIRKPRSFVQLALTPLIAIATILVFFPLANAWTAFLNLIGMKASVETPAFSNAGTYFLALFVMALLPAIGEEYLMRGHVFHGLSTRNVWFGILISAVFFSLMHANPVQTVHQFGIGAVLALVMILSGSIWACVLVHFFNNFISLTITAYLPQVNQIISNLGYFNWLTGAASFIVGLLLLIVLLYIMYRLGSKDEFKVIGNTIEYEEFSIYAVQPADVKRNPAKDFFMFFKSLFTRAGWRNLTRTLTQMNGVEQIGKAQPMIGVWLALGLSAAYWLYAFISGLL